MTVMLTSSTLVGTIKLNRGVHMKVTRGMKRLAMAGALTAGALSFGPTTSSLPSALGVQAADAAPANCGTALDANTRGAWGSCNGGFGSFRVFVNCTAGTNASGWISIPPGGSARTFVGCGWKGWPRSAWIQVRD